MARVRFGRTLREAAGAAELDVDGASLHAVLDSLGRSHPAVERRIRDESGALRRHVAVFVDGTLTTDQTVALDPTVTVDVIPAISGG